MNKKVKVGDIFSIRVNETVAYIQLVLIDKKYGYLIRKIEGLYTFSDSESHDMARIVSRCTDFYTFTPLQSIFNGATKNEYTEEGTKVDLTFIENIDLPHIDKNPPMLQGHSGRWNIRVNGEKKYLGKVIPDKFKGLSVVRGSNYEALLYRITSGYKSKYDPIYG